MAFATEFCVQVGPLVFIKQQNIPLAAFQGPGTTWALQGSPVSVQPLPQHLQ